MHQGENTHFLIWQRSFVLMWCLCVSAYAGFWIAFYLETDFFSLFKKNSMKKLQSDAKIKTNVLFSFCLSYWIIYVDVEKKKQLLSSSNALDFHWVKSSSRHHNDFKHIIYSLYFDLDSAKNCLTLNHILKSKAKTLFSKKKKKKKTERKEKGKTKKNQFVSSLAVSVVQQTF